MTPRQSAKKTVAQILDDRNRALMQKLRVCSPARVIAVTKTDPMRVTVELGTADSYGDGDTVKGPVIQEVPVQWPTANGGQAFIRLPLAANDTGVLVFGDRSLDNWLKGSGRSVDPQDNRMHDLTDAIFIPGVQTDSGTVNGGYLGNTMKMANGAMSITLDPTGKITIQGASGEVMQVLVTAFTALSLATDMFAGLPLSSAGAMATAANDLTLLKGA